MFKVIIYKDKITYTLWEDKIQDWVEIEVTETEPLSKHFHKLVEIKEDVTVEDFMLHLEKHERDIDYCFAGYMDSIPFKLYLDDMKKEPTLPIDIQEIEMFWFGEILNGEINIIGAIRGWLSEEGARKKGLNPDVPYGMEYTPINLWKKCPFILNDNIIINDFGDIEAMSDTMVFDGYKSWSLYEVISNFLCDLSENGSPEDRDNLVSQMEVKKYDIHEVSQDKEQTEFWLGFLQAELGDSRAAMDRALEDENYEEAAKLKNNMEIISKEILDLKKEAAKLNNKTKADE